MKSSLVSLLALLVLVAPASAGSDRHHARRHGHVVGTPARHGEAGFPITAAKDSIRINAVGEVISRPVSVIQKERTFDTRARQELSRPRPNPAPQP